MVSLVNAVRMRFDSHLEDVCRYNRMKSSQLETSQDVCHVGTRR